MEKQYNYTNIIQVLQTSSEKTVNEYLDLGWVLLNVATECRDDPRFSEYTEFTLGWDKIKGEVKKPEYIKNMPF